MATAPLLRTLKQEGFTTYQFSSASRDLSRTLNNENLRFKFSKFVLLDIPDFDKLPTNFSNYQNYTQFDTIDGKIFNGGLDPDININLTESLQNYLFNLEKIILSNPNYNESENRSVSERCFWKWLKELGSIRFREANQNEKSNSIGDKLFVEEDENETGSVQYKRVVKYIGDIDLVNNVNLAGESYTEVLINVPTEVGNTPTILFDSIEDDNYSPNLRITGEDEYILGRDDSTIHPESLSLNAFYDYDNNLQGSGSAGYTNSNANWMNASNTTSYTNSYYTEPSFKESDNLDIIKISSDYGNPSNFTQVSYRRSKLDGIGVVFDPDNYEQITTDPGINTIQELNSSDLSNTFEFNAILIYYDLEDLSDDSNSATNLFSISFVDNITPTTDGGYIRRIPKYKLNSSNNQNGTSQSFKLNFRIDASVGNAGVETIINDYNTFSLSLFSEASAQLQESVKMFMEQRKELNRLHNKINEFDNLLPNSSINSLQSQINSLQRQLENSSGALSSQSSILDLISKNADEIQSIANGRVSQTLQYNTDVIRKGPGIKINKNTPNLIQIELENQQYNLNRIYDFNGLDINSQNPYDLSISSNLGIYSDLEYFSNMMRIFTINNPKTDIKIFINDSRITWREGQSFKIIFNSEFNIGSNNIRIFTDSLNRLNSGKFGVTCATIPNKEISNKPMIELVCINNRSLEFVFDVLK